MENTKDTHTLKLRQDRYTKLMHIPAEISRELNWNKGDTLELTVIDGVLNVKKIADSDK